MTKTIEQARREAFEAAISRAWIDQGYHPDSIPSVMARGSDGEYQTIRIAGAWIGYNAAMDSLCITLPERIHIDYGECGSSLDIACAHNNAVHACREAIHAAGVKTR